MILSKIIPGVANSFLYFGFLLLFFSTELFSMHHLRPISERINMHQIRRVAMATMTASRFDYPKQEAEAPKILRYGDPKLYEPSLPFDLPKEMPLVHEVLEQMKLATKGMGNVGLAAPQIGILKQLVMFAVPAEHPRYKTDGVAQPMRIMINPHYKHLSDEKNLEWEGCLSVPGMMGQVKRYTHIECTYIDLEGVKQSFNASNFHARVVQHELDHLRGILFPLLVENRHMLGFTEAIMESEEFKKSRGF
jgi:peptide deformylase